jgi:hypothetical protein
MKLSIPEVAAGPIAAALALSFASFLAGAAWARRGGAAAAPLPRPSITLVGDGLGAPDLITLALALGPTKKCSV